jgi:effector-binding domain-containing protein
LTAERRILARHQPIFKQEDISSMLDTPQITLTADTLTAVIRLTIPREEIRNVMGPGLRELTATVAAQGIVPTGPWFNHHLRTDPHIFDFEISVPVGSQVAAAGRVEPGNWPATKVARTVYFGGYEGLGEAWREFNDWIAVDGHRTAPDFWECYVIGPESSPDPSAWRTELTRRLIA